MRRIGACFFASVLALAVYPIPMRKIRLAASLLFLGPLAANATPIGVLHDNGDGTITDHSTNLMWLKDANYARTELTDAWRDAIIAAGNAAPPYSDVYTLTAGDFQSFVPGSYSGEMTWWAAMAWADQLVYAGYDDWRLPTSAHPDPTCTDGILPSLGFNCTGSELGNLYYVALGNPAGGPASNRGPIINLPSSQIWSSTEFDLSDCGAFNFIWSTGLQDACRKEQYEHAWAVRTISVVPEPGTIALLASGLAAIGFARRKRTGGTVKREHAYEV